MRMNITDKLQIEQPVLEIAGKEFPVDNSKNTMLAFQQMLREEGKDKTAVELYDAGIRHFLSEDSAAAIEGMHLSLKGCEKVFIAIMALVSEQTYEEAEERFRNAGSQPAVV